MGKCIVQSRQSIPKLEVHIISKVITHNISFTSNYLKNCMWLIWALRIIKFI